MVDLRVRGLSRETIKWLEKRAALHQRSAGDEARHVIMEELAKRRTSSGGSDPNRRKGEEHRGA